VTGSKDRSIRIYDLATFELKHQLQPPHYDSISCLALVDDTLYSGGGSQIGFIKQWNLKTLKSNLTSNSAHKDSLTSMVRLRGFGASTPSHLLLSAGKDGTMKLWSASNLEAIQEVRGHEQTINHVALHPTDPGLFYTASNDKTVKVWRLKAPQ